MPRLQRKPLRAPDEVRQFKSGRMDVVTLDDMAIGYMVFEPGWRWSVDVAPIVGTRSCQNRHVGYAIEGRMHIVMDDGSELDILGGDAYEIPTGHDAWVASDATWVALEWSSARIFGISPEEGDDRVLATILFTDLVDSTPMLRRLGDEAWRRLLLEHNDRVRSLIDRHRGREIGTTGDGFLALFDGPARAARCAAAIGPAVADLGVAVRAGLHTGEVAIAAGQARGLAVHAAARIAALAGPGQVYLSGTTRDLLEGSGLDFADLGPHELKGLEGPRQIYSLVRS